MTSLPPGTEAAGPDAPPADLPLSGITVLDLSIARAGPAAVRLLSDWGADVIRVEPPPPQDRGSVTGRRRGSDEQNLHRNKRSLCLDLKTPQGAEVLARWCASRTWWWRTSARLSRSGWG